MGFGPGRGWRAVGRGGIPFLRAPLGCTETSPEVDVAGVVEVEAEATAEELSVEDDMRPARPFLWSLVWPLLSADCRGSSV